MLYTIIHHKAIIEEKCTNSKYTHIREVCISLVKPTKYTHNSDMELNKYLIINFA